MLHKSEYFCNFVIQKATQKKPPASLFSDKHGGTKLNKVSTKLNKVFQL